MGANVLILGSGGREHALAWALDRSPLVQQVFVAPGSDGIAEVARCVDANGVEAWIAAAREHDIDLVVVGPEAPLVEGAADALREAGIRVFGPGRDAARLEGDKSFAKDFLSEFEIPTAASQSFDDAEKAAAFLRSHPGPWVVKATGLAAGKGVSVCDDEVQAEAEARRMLEGGAFGAAGSRILIEERMVGRELSVFAVLDGSRMAWFSASRDHKRLLSGDGGPNTGGMGAFTPVADATPEIMEEIRTKILERTLSGLQSRGMDYRGLLYVGILLDRGVPKVVEYNCRFGDPETQVVLPVFDGDLYELLAGAADGKLAATGALGTRGAAVGFVLAAAGYPQSPRKGDRIEGIAELAGSTLVFHAGTRRDADRWLTNGGRVLCVVSTHEDLRAAREAALASARRIRFEGAQMREDIASQEENGA